MNYELRQSNRKTVSVEVKPDGTVLVRAPLHWSKKECNAFVESHTEWIEKARERQALRAEKHPARSEEELRHLRAQFRETIEKKTAHYAAIMGVTPAGITITTAKTRFGSCSSKNRLSFSLLLADYPEEAIDYVVVHELAHIRHHNHGKAFYAFVESVLPNRKALEKLLKE